MLTWAFGVLGQAALEDDAVDILGGGASDEAAALTRGAHPNARPCG
jgi:hypothetical protein